MSKQIIPKDGGPIQMVPKVAFWGKLAGGFYDTRKPKGANYEWGLVVQMKKWGAGSNNSGPTGHKLRWRPKYYVKTKGYRTKTATPQQSLALKQK